MSDVLKQLQQIQEQLTLMQEAILSYDDDVKKGYNLATSFAQIACSATEKTYALTHKMSELTECLQELIASNPNIALTSSNPLLRELASTLIREGTIRG